MIMILIIFQISVVITNDALLALLWCCHKYNLCHGYWLLQHTPATYFFINILPFRIQIEWSGSKFGLLIVIGIKWCIAKCQDDTLHGVKLSKAPSSLTRWTNYVKFLTGQWSSEIFINNSIFSKGHIIKRFPSNMWGKSRMSPLLLFQSTIWLSDRSW